MNVERVTERMGFKAVRARLLQQAAPALTNFRGALKSSTPTVSAPHTVASGENLSGIVKKQLSQAGHTPTNTEVYAGVDRVARANGLKNPDVLQVGQKIDLSVLHTPLNQALPEQQGGPVLNHRPISDFMIHTAAQSKTGLAETIRQALQKNTAFSPQQGEAWALPLHQTAAEISSPYGVRKDPFTGRLDFHDGIDFAAASGTPIYAAKSGTVSFSGWKPGYGQVVMLQHEGGLATLYAHTSKNLVKTGEQVDENTIIGRVGSTGRSTGAHLHFETHLNGCTVNPAPYLATAQTQLAKNTVSN